MQSVPVSVVIPLYNAEKYISRCLNALCSQSYSNLEIVVVNDGSTDGSENLVREFSEKDQRVKLLCKQNGGVASAVVSGVKAASGEYVTFIDADDYVGENHIKNFMDNIGDADILSMGFYYEKAEGRSAFELAADIEFTGEELNELKNNFIGNSLKLSNRIFVARWNKLYKTRTVLENIDIYAEINLGYDEDSYFTFLALNAASKVKSLKMPNSYYYCLHEQTLTRNVKRYDEFTELCNRLKSASTTVSARLGVECVIDRKLIALLGLEYSKNYATGLSGRDAAKQVKKIVQDAEFKAALGGYKFSELDFKSKIKYILFKLKMKRLIVFFMKKQA